MRLLVAGIAALGANGIALLLAAALLDGVEIRNLAFPVLIVLYTAVSVAVSFIVDAFVFRYAAAVVVLGGVISSFLALLVTDAVSDSITIEGRGTWVVATLLVWLASLVFRPMVRRWGRHHLGPGPQQRRGR